MILLVDVGNTRIKWLLWDRGRILNRGNLVHKNKDRLSLGDACWRNLPRPAQIHIANVAGPEMAKALDRWIDNSWGITAHFAMTERQACGVSNAYANPDRLGVDRWVALVGARALTRRSCCIVDCGTATTVDAMSETGEHLGGVIFPGVRLMRESLYRDTKQISTETGTVTLFGKDTQDCVWGGTAHAVAGAIDHIIRRMEESMDGKPDRLLTGGDAEFLRPHLDSNYYPEPDLIFKGLLALAGKDVTTARLADHASRDTV